MSAQKADFSYQGKILVLSLIIVSILLIIVSLFSLYQGLTIIGEISSEQKEFKEIVAALFSSHKEGLAYLFTSIYSLLMAIVFALFAVVAKIKR